MKILYIVGMIFIALSFGSCLYEHKPDEALAWSTAFAYASVCLSYEIKRTK